MEDGLVRPIEWDLLRRFPRADIMAWCVKNGVYQVPTWELIDWLKHTINGDPAIEICAGKSCIGRYLGIPMTDSYQQTNPLVALYYATRMQMPAIPPPDVERLDAHQAIAKYRPKIVIGAWVTKHSWIRNQGNYWGVHEEQILRAGCTYIHIGNDDPHGDVVWRTSSCESDMNCSTGCRFDPCPSNGSSTVPSDYKAVDPGRARAMTK